MSKFGELFLRRLSRNPDEPDYPAVQYYVERHSDIDVCKQQFDDFFPGFSSQISGKKALDIGCAEGMETIALCLLGAKEAVGIDIRIDPEQSERLARELAPDSNLSFYAMDAGSTAFPDFSFDSIVSLSSFEHFSDPLRILKESYRILKDDGRLYLTSGVWRSPYGAHMHFFTSLPWVHFIFSEKTIMGVRSLYRKDGAKKYSEVEGGLNDITVGKFEKYVQLANFEIDYFYLNPVKRLTLLTKIPYLREYFTNLLVAVLRK